MKSKSCKGYFLQINFPPMRTLKFVRGHVIFKLRYNQIHQLKTTQVGLLDGRTLWFNRDHLFHDCCDLDLPKIFTSPTHCDLSNITYILLYSGSFQKENIKNKSAFRLWPRHRSLPIHSGNFFDYILKNIFDLKRFFLENCTTGLNESGFLTT